MGPHAAALAMLTPPCQGRTMHVSLYHLGSREPQISKPSPQKQTGTKLSRLPDASAAYDSATCAILENIDLEVPSDLDLNVSSSLIDCGILNKSLGLSEILSSMQQGYSCLPCRTVVDSQLFNTSSSAYSNTGHCAGHSVELHKTSMIPSVRQSPVLEWICQSSRPREHI